MHLMNPNIDQTDCYLAYHHRLTTNRNIHVDRFILS